MFNARKQILLTGAGFSKDFGGYLATQMWSVIFSQPEISLHPDIRDVLLSQLDYELAYSKVLHAGAFGDDAKADFTKAVERSYQQMHEAFYESAVRIPAVGVCKAIVGAFCGGEERERGFVFTLNQDLFMERFFINNADAPSDMKIPGLTTHGYCFNYRLPKDKPSDFDIVLPDASKVRRLDEGFWKEKAYGRFSYLKLHGSQWWKSASGSNVMIIGSEKSGAIEREPYLKWSHSVFEKVVAGPDADLVVIGYGFFDDHINKVIANAVKRHGLKIYVVSPENPEQFRNKLLPSQGFIGERRVGIEEGKTLWEGLHGYYCCRVTDLYSGHGGALTPIGRSLLSKVGLG